MLTLLCAQLCKFHVRWRVWRRVALVHHLFFAKTWHETSTVLGQNMARNIYGICLVVACTYCTSDHSLSSNADKFDKVTKTLKLSAMHTPPSVLKPTCSGFAFLILANQGLHTNTQKHTPLHRNTQIHTTGIFLVGDFLCVQWFVLGLQMASFCLLPRSNWLLSNIDRATQNLGFTKM